DVRVLDFLEDTLRNDQGQCYDDLLNALKRHVISEYMLRFCFQHNLIDNAQKILKVCPELTKRFNDNPETDWLAIAIREGNLRLAVFLLKNGWDPTKKKETTDET